MSSDLRVALRIQANAGNSRREIQALERDLRKAGKDGAKALADDSAKATDALAKTGRAGAASYKIIRQAMRDTATQGSGVFRQDVIQTQGDLKQMGQIGRQAAREVKAELARTAREGTEPLRRSVERTDDSLRRLAQNGGRNLRMLKTIASSARKEFDRIKGLGGTVQGQLAGAGLGIGVVSGLTGSARRDRQLIRTQQTAGMTVAQREEWRTENWRLAKTYGVDSEQVQTGFDTLIASGLSYDKAKASSGAIAQATAVTGADSGILAKALVTGASAFDIDLSQPQAALDILQKMIVAGRLGNAELENLSSIFPKVGQDAKRAGMTMAQSLSFVETLSLIELEPDRLGTLAQSTLRTFTNDSYRKEVTKNTGVDFFDKNGKTRNTQDVFIDLQKKYQTLRNDKERARFMGVVFGKMDQDTQKGVNAFLTGDRLANFARSTGDINNAKGVVERDLADNLSSTTAVGSRMKATLGEAIDRMARPLNKGFADLGSYLLDDLNMSGEQLLFGGAAAAASGYYAGRGAKAGAGALMNKFLGGPETLKNIAVGKVLEEATGVTSVFVTNWPTAGLGLGNIANDLPDIGGGSGKGKGRFRAPRVPKFLAPLALAYEFTQLGGSTGQNTDEDRLALAAKNKLLDDGQRTYQEAFYRNRISLLNQNPNQTSDWASTQARRLAQQETGLTAAGGSVDSANNWASGVAGRAIDAGIGTIAAAERLSQLLDKPLVIELRMDSHYIQAEVERRADIQVRRGQ
ncbi:phage tail tape measure protein [Pseudomonas sp. LF195]